MSKKIIDSEKLLKERKPVHMLPIEPAVIFSFCFDPFGRALFYLLE